MIAIFEGINPKIDRRVIKGLRQAGRKKTNANVRTTGRCDSGQPTHTMALKLASFGIVRAQIKRVNALPFLAASLLPTTSIFLQI